MNRSSSLSEDPVDYIAKNGVGFGTDLTGQANAAASLNNNKCWFKVERGQLVVCEEEEEDEEDAVEAYWCPYIQNGGMPIMLSGDADEPGVMFTAKMNGCTFDIAYAADGAARVVHVNDSLAASGSLSIGKAIKAQTSSQHRMAFEALEQIPHRGIDTSVGEQIRIVGVRREGKWRFWKIDKSNVVTKLGHREAERYLDIPHVGPTGEEKVKDKKCIVM